MNGFCAPNDIRPFTESDLAVISAGRFTHAKIRDYHGLAHIGQLAGVGVRHILTMFPDLYPGKKLDAHIEDCWHTIKSVWPLCNIFLTANEPNEDSSGWRGQPWVFASHLRFVLVRIFERAANAGMVLYFVLPPLSYAPKFFGEELQGWKDAFSKHPDKDGLVPSLTSMHQYAGANCYWEYQKYMLDGAYGMSWQDVAQWAGGPDPLHPGIWVPKSTIVTEFGYSGFHTNKEKNRARAHATMAKQYPQYHRENAKRGAAASFVFAVGGTEEWDRFAISTEVASSISQAFS